MYTKSWNAFDRLIAVIPPGGSIGCVFPQKNASAAYLELFYRLDDKLFSFWVLQGESFPFSHVKGIFRFETGIKVNEFRDLRANPRYVLSIRVQTIQLTRSLVQMSPRKPAPLLPRSIRTNGLKRTLLPLPPAKKAPLVRRVQPRRCL